MLGSGAPHCLWGPETCWPLVQRLRCCLGLGPTCTQTLEGSLASSCMALELSLLKGCSGSEMRESREGSWSHCALRALRDAPGGKRLLLSTLQEEYELVSPSSVAIAEMVALFLAGLKERSVFALALQDRKATGTHWEREGAHGTCGEGWLSHIHKTQSEA